MCSPRSLHTEHRSSASPGPAGDRSSSGLGDVGGSGLGDQAPLSPSTSLARKPQASQIIIAIAAVQDLLPVGQERPEQVRGWEEGRKELPGRAACQGGAWGGLHPGI